MNEPTQHRLLSLPEAAAVIGRSRSVMNYYARTGLLRAERVGGTLIVSRDELERLAAYLATGETRRAGNSGRPRLPAADPETERRRAGYREKTRRWYERRKGGPARARGRGGPRAD